MNKYYKFILELCHSLTFLITGILSVYLVGQAPNYTPTLGFAMITPFALLAFNKLINAQLVFHKAEQTTKR